MKFTSLIIPEIVLIEPRVIGDSRGYFVETFRQDLFDEAVGQHIDFIQDNESSSRRGVLRGLHFQVPPFAQSKLVRVITGAILDVVVDVRRGSPSYGQHVSAELSAENSRQMFVPRGFAHGFVVLSDEAIVSYKVDNLYSAEFDKGIAWNDPAIGIDWQIPLGDIQLSEKDRAQPLLNDALIPFEYGRSYYE